MGLHKNIITLSLVTLAACTAFMAVTLRPLFEHAPTDRPAPAAEPEVKRVFAWKDTSLKRTLDEVRMNPGTRIITEKNAPENLTGIPEEPAAAEAADETLSAGPGNPLPTNEEIEAQIKAQNEKRELAEKLAAQRDKKVERVSKQVRSLGKALSPDKAPSESANQAPAGSIVQKVKSGEYVFN